MAGAHVPMALAGQGPTHRGRWFPPRPSPTGLIQANGMGPVVAATVLHPYLERYRHRAGRRWRPMTSPKSLGVAKMGSTDRGAVRAGQDQGPQTRLESS